MSNTTPAFIAGGDIYPCRFVKQSTAADFTVLEADANEATFGISQEGTLAAPIPSASALASSAGNPIRIHGPGDVCLLTLGSGGATRGNNLKSDADGKGVAAATTGTTLQEIGAVALQSGLEGEKIQVFVRQFKHYPALA